MTITQELIDAERKNMSRAKFYVWFKQYALEKYGVNIISINYENQLNSDMWEAWQAAISQHKAVPDVRTAKQRYDKYMVGVDEPDPVERLRFFLSQALTGQDWFDVEPFLDAVNTPSDGDK